MLLLMSEGCTVLFVFCFFPQKEPFDWAHHQYFWNMGHSPRQKLKFASLPKLDVCMPPPQVRYMEVEPRPNNMR
jgi:hypothetical protein